MATQKDADNETANNEQTAKRINSYVREFAQLLARGNIAGGYLAVATNKKQAANEWVIALNYMAILNGLTSSAGHRPSFKIEKAGRKTWITYW